MERTILVKGKSGRPGLCYCNECRKQSTVTVGTVFERSKIGLPKWWLAVHLLSSSKKGLSAHQLHRMLGVTYKIAWFMCHRIREAMRDFNPSPMCSEGQSVQVDETYFGNRANPEMSPSSMGRPYIHTGGGPARKRAVFALLSGGQVRTFHVKRATANIARQILLTNVRRETELHTDESRT